MSGTQMQHAKESNADIMRQKQAAGMSEPPPNPENEPYNATTTNQQAAAL
jgi:hypothetical protein